MIARRDELTQIRALSCIAIVFLHTFYAAYAYADTFSRKALALGVRNLMLWAVPCFVMVTGVLLLEKERVVSYRKLFGKYILRMGIALVAFSLLFGGLDGAFSESETVYQGLWTGLQNIVTGGGWRHMWYLYLMIAIYLLLPIYRKIAASLTHTDTCYLLTVYFLFLSILPFLEDMTETGIGFYICVYSIYPFYLFLGYAFSQGTLTKRRSDGKPITWIWAVIAVVSILVEAILTVCSEKYEWTTLADALTSYSFPLVLLQAAGIFGWIYQKKPNLPRWFDAILKQIDACSFGIYLIHMVFLKLVLVWLAWNPYLHGGSGMVFLLTFAVFLCTFLCVWLLKKIPGLKWLL